MSHDQDAGVTAASALVGGVATIVQELVVSGAVDPERLRRRLHSFVQQDSIQKEHPDDRDLIERVIGTLTQAIDFGQAERRDNDNEA